MNAELKTLIRIAKLVRTDLKINHGHHHATRTDYQRSLRRAHRAAFNTEISF